MFALLDQNPSVQSSALYALFIVLKMIYRTNHMCFMVTLVMMATAAAQLSQWATSVPILCGIFSHAVSAMTVDTAKPTTAVVPLLGLLSSMLSSGLQRDGHLTTIVKSLKLERVLNNFPALTSNPPDPGLFPKLKSQKRVKKEGTQCVEHGKVLYDQQGQWNPLPQMLPADLLPYFFTPKQEDECFDHGEANIVAVNTIRGMNQDKDNVQFENPNCLTVAKALSFAKAHNVALQYKNKPLTTIKDGEHVAVENNTKFCFDEGISSKEKTDNTLYNWAVQLLHAALAALWFLFTKAVALLKIVLEQMKQFASGVRQRFAQKKTIRREECNLSRWYTLKVASVPNRSLESVFASTVYKQDMVTLYSMLHARHCCDDNNTLPPSVRAQLLQARTETWKNLCLNNSGPGGKNFFATLLESEALQAVKLQQMWRSTDDTLENEACETHFKAAVKHLNQQYKLNLALPDNLSALDKVLVLGIVLTMEQTHSTYPVHEKLEELLREVLNLIECNWQPAINQN